jgi:hypothetical protein
MYLKKKSLNYLSRISGLGHLLVNYSMKMLKKRKQGKKVELGNYI